MSLIGMGIHRHHLVVFTAAPHTAVFGVPTQAAMHNLGMRAHRRANKVYNETSPWLSMAVW